MKNHNNDVSYHSPEDMMKALENRCKSLNLNYSIRRTDYHIMLNKSLLGKQL